MIWDLMNEWSKCREAMLEAIEQCKGTHTEDDVLLMLMQGKLKLFTQGRSGVIVEVVAYPRLNALHAFLVAGDMAEVLEIEKMLPAFAKANNCARITACGRHGWSKVLPEHGWKVVTTFMQKDI